MRWIILLIVPLVVIIMLLPIRVGNTGSFYSLLNVADESITTLPKIISVLKKARIIYLGELHDNPRHHAAQLSVIRLLHEADVPIAVGLEMFQAEHQAALDDWTSGQAEVHEFIQAYHNNWKFPWRFYRDIFMYAREHRIPLIGLNVPPEITRQVARKGFASLSREQMQKLPGVSCNVDPNYRKFIKKAVRFHGKGKSFNNFCEAQMVWDTTMAWNIVTFLEKNPDFIIVVLAGGGHAWKPGIPTQVERHKEIQYQVILPEVSTKQEISKITKDEADYLWLGI